MPGGKDPLHSRFDFQTDFTLHRSVVTADADVNSVSAVRDLSRSISALRNRMQILPRRTSGSGTITVDLYVLLSGVLSNVWYKFTSVTNSATDVVNTISNLPAGKYKLVCTPSAVSVWEIHLSDSDNYGHE